MKWKKFKKEVAEQVKQAIMENKEILEKASATDGKFKVVMSSNIKDRAGEIVLQDGLDTSNYEKNPIVLFAHDYSELPIGKIVKLTKESDKLIGEGVFVSKEINPKAQQVRKLYDAGIMKAVSIGFIAKEWEGNVITESELLELSFVPVPANPEALDIAKEKGLEKEFKNVCKKNVKESKELIAIKKMAEVMKEMTVEFKNIKKQISKLGEDLVGIQNQVTKDNKKSKGEYDLSEFLKDTNNATQMISRIADNINNKFNKLK